MKNLQETSLAHLFDMWNKYDLGMISAYRHKVDGLDKDPDISSDHYWQKSNRIKNSDLGKDIKNAGYWYTQTMGGYPEKNKKGDLENVKERSFFVVNKDMQNDDARKAFEDFMFDMCKKYGQDSVYMSTKNYPSGLYDKDRRPVNFGDGPMIGLNDFNSNSNQDYYSRVNGSKFSFQQESIEIKSNFRQLVENILHENGYDDWLQKSIDDLKKLDSQIEQLNKYGEVRIENPLEREQFINYCNSDEGFEKCDFDPNDLRIEDNLIYLV